MMPSVSDGVQLYPEVIEAIRQFVYSDAWEHFYKPSLVNMKEEWTRVLMTPYEMRSPKYSDDYIRGCFATIDVFLQLPETLILEHDAEIEQREREKAEAGVLRARADSGYVGQ